MPAFVEVACPCGRRLRAQRDQAGTSIRCWECGGEVPVPHPRPTLEGLVFACLDSARETLALESSGGVLAGAVAAAAFLSLPGIGPYLGLGVLVVAAWLYEGMITRSGRKIWPPGEAAPVRPPSLPRTAWDLAHTTGKDRLEEESDNAGTGWRWVLRPQTIRRAILAVLGAGVVVAPFVLRNGGGWLPTEDQPAGLWLFLAGLAGWLVFPVVLLAVQARDHEGRLSPGRAIGSLIRHPLSTLAALLVVPLGMAGVEAVVSEGAEQAGYLPVLVSDLFPPPEIQRFEADGIHLIYRYLGNTADLNFTGGPQVVNPIYKVARRRGFTLVGTIPPSLAYSREPRVPVRLFLVTEIAYQAVRFVLAVPILVAAGLLFSFQARWLGRIAPLDAHGRPSRVDAPAPPPA